MQKCKQSYRKINKLINNAHWMDWQHPKWVFHCVRTGRSGDGIFQLRIVEFKCRCGWEGLSIICFAELLDAKSVKEYSYWYYHPPDTKILMNYLKRKQNVKKKLNLDAKYREVRPVLYRLHSLFRLFCFCIFLIIWVAQLNYIPMLQLNYLLVNTLVFLTNIYLVACGYVNV